MKLSYSLYDYTLKAASSSHISRLAHLHFQFASVIAASCSGLHGNTCMAPTSLGLLRTKTDKLDSWSSELCQLGEYLHVQLPLKSFLKLFSIYHCPATGQAHIMLTDS